MYNIANTGKSVCSAIFHVVLRKGHQLVAEALDDLTKEVTELHQEKKDLPLML